MQNFAINGGALNGAPEVWLDEVATAAVVLQGDGAVMQGLSLQGTAQTVVAADGTMAFGASLTGQAGVVLSGSGQVQRGATLSGASSIQLAAAGDFTRWVMIEGETPLELYMDGDIQVAPGVSATFDIVLSADCDLHVGVGQKIEGYMPIELRGDLRGHHVKATHLGGYAYIELAALGHAALKIMSPPGVATIQLAGAGDLRFGEKIGLEGLAPVQFSASLDAHVGKPVHVGGYAPIEFASLGLGSLVIQSPPGAAVIEFAAAGDARFGERVPLEGYAGIGIFSRADVGTIHYVYAEGTATIEIAAWAAVAGKPIIPTEYEPAPTARTIRIGREARESSLARENRSVA